MNHDIHQDDNKVAQEDSVHRDIYQAVPWMVTNAMFHTTSLKTIYKSMPLANDYDMSDTTERLPMLNAVYRSTVQVLGRAKAHFIS